MAAECLLKHLFMLGKSVCGTNRGVNVMSHYPVGQNALLGLKCLMEKEPMYVCECMQYTFINEKKALYSSGQILVMLYDLL